MKTYHLLLIDIYDVPLSIRSALAMPENRPDASRRRFSGRLDHVPAGSPSRHIVRGCRFSGHQPPRVP
eukprot:3433934-Amphidinium_carterae.1